MEYECQCKVINKKIRHELDTVKARRVYLTIPVSIRNCQAIRPRQLNAYAKASLTHTHQE